MFYDVIKTFLAQYEKNSHSDHDDSEQLKFDDPWTSKSKTLKFSTQIWFPRTFQGLEKTQKLSKNVWPLSLSHGTCIIISQYTAWLTHTFSLYEIQHGHRWPHQPLSVFWQ